MDASKKPIKWPPKFDKVAKHLAGYELKEVDCKGILAALTFIFKSAAKYACDHDVLSNELQQLGLHRDGAQLLSRLYQSKLKELRRALEQNSFRGEFFVSFFKLIFFVQSLLGSN